MKIEVGGMYVLRNGTRIGPVNKNGIDGYPFDEDTDAWVGGSFWNENGESDEDPEFDVVGYQDGYGGDTTSASIETTNHTPDYASLAAQHGIKITVQVGEVIVEYDGRVG